MITASRGSGSIAPDMGWLIVLGLPAILLGVWLGMKLYGRLSESGFRTLVLALLGLSGAALLLK